MKLPPYPHYKPSGVEWLGDVPKHWELKRIKHLGSIRYGLGEPPEYVDEGLPFVRATDIKRGKINLDEVKKVRSEDVPWSRRPLLNLDEILVVRSGAYTGDSAIVPSIVAGCIAGYDMVLSVTRAQPAFVAWALLSKYLLQGQIYLERMRAAQPHLNAEELGGFLILTPPIPEQRAIAAFLDRETGRLDRLVAKKRELIERLKEKRTALISRTVTRGLPPGTAKKYPQIAQIYADEMKKQKFAGQNLRSSADQLPENPPLKPSGLDWLGDIPTHWEVVPLGYLVRFSGGATPDKSNSAYWDGSIPWVSPKDMKVARIADAEDHVSPEALANSALRLMSVDSVLIVVRGMILAHSFPVALTTAPVTINQDMKAVACGKRLTPHFLSWSFTGFAKSFVSFADESAHGTRKLETGTLTRFPFLLPPLSEQTAIAAYLEAETAKLDALVGKVEEAVERLQEYRTALITAAVTGKIDVRKNSKATTLTP